MATNLTALAEHIDRVLEHLQHATRRGRPAAQDQRMAKAGLIPVGLAANLLGRSVTSMHQACAAGHLPLVQASGFWYAQRDTLLAFAANPPRRGRTPKKG